MTRALVALLAVLAATLFGATAATPVLPAEAVDTALLRAAVSATRIRDHLTALQSIATANGGNRAAGTSGYQDSVDYVRQRLTAAGYQVSVQPFRFPYFAENAAPTLTRLGTDRKTFTSGTDLRTMTYSGAGDVTAPVSPVHLTIPPSLIPSSNSACRRGDFAAFPRGAVALVQRGTCPFAEKAAAAKAAGASAVLIMNEGQGGRTEPVTGTLGEPGIGIPVLGVSYAVGAALAGGPARTLRVATDVVSEQRETVNVIADSTGGRPDRVVMVGAHLDSAPEGPGINDDGSGVGTVLEIADQLARQPINPRNRVRFAFWGGEELGLLGSTHYVAALDPVRRSDVMAYLNFDMLGSPNFGRFVYDGDGSAGGPPGPAGSGVIERLFTDHFATQRLPTSSTAFDGRSDYGPFAAAGIPSGGLFSGAEEVKSPADAARFGGTPGQSFDGCYHRACDTVDNISDVALKQFGDAAADAVLRLVMSPVDPRQVR